MIVLTTSGTGIGQSGYSWGNSHVVSTGTASWNTGRSGSSATGQGHATLSVQQIRQFQSELNSPNKAVATNARLMLSRAGVQSNTPSIIGTTSAGTPVWSTDTASAKISNVQWNGQGPSPLSPGMQLSTQGRTLYQTKPVSDNTPKGIAPSLEQPSTIQYPKGSPVKTMDQEGLSPTGFCKG